MVDENVMKTSLKVKLLYWKQFHRPSLTFPLSDQDLDPNFYKKQHRPVTCNQSLQQADTTEKDQEGPELTGKDQEGPERTREQTEKDQEGPEKMGDDV